MGFRSNYPCDVKGRTHVTCGKCSHVITNSYISVVVVVAYPERTYPEAGC